MMCDRQLLNWTLLNPTQRASLVLNSNYITGTVCVSSVVGLSKHPNALSLILQSSLEGGR